MRMRERDLKQKILVRLSERDLKQKILVRLSERDLKQKILVRLSERDLRQKVLEGKDHNAGWTSLASFINNSRFNSLTPFSIALIS